MANSLIPQDTLNRKKAQFLTDIKHCRYLTTGRLNKTSKAYAKHISIIKNSVILLCEVPRTEAQNFLDEGR